MTPDGPTGPSHAPATDLDLAGLPLRSSLRRLKPYQSPRPTVPVLLNINENPYPLSPAVVDDILAAIRSVVTDLNRYPDRDAGDVRADIATYLTRRIGVAIDVTNVWAANGSSEIVQQLMQAFGGAGRRALSFVPTYSLYRTVAASLDTEWLEFPRDHDFTLDIDEAVAAITENDPHLTFITNPHNPTGHFLGTSELHRILSAASGIVVVDEAYGEFSSGTSAIPLIQWFPDKLVVTRTLSKALGFAGGRLGYLVAAPAVVEAMRIVSLPYHLSTLTQVAARAVLRHADDILRTVDALGSERRRVADALRRSGFEVIDSEANFLLFGIFADASRAWQQYVDQGVAVRDVGLPHHLRVTIGSGAENDIFLEAGKVLTAVRESAYTS